MARRATLFATIGRAERPIFSGNPDDPDHGAFVSAAKIACINECRSGGAQAPTFRYVTATLPRVQPEVVEREAPLPDLTPKEVQ